MVDLRDAASITTPKAYSAFAFPARVSTQKLGNFCNGNLLGPTPEAQASVE